MNKQSRTSRAGASTPLRSNPAPPSSAEAQASATDPAPPPLITGDSASIQRWLEASRTSLLDLHAAAQEGARRSRKRVLSRAEIRRQAREAFAQLTALLDLAAEALQKTT